MKQLIYQSVNLAQWQALSSMLERIFSLSIKTPNGSSRQWDFGFEWHYDELAQSFSLKCIKKPRWVPEALFESQIEALIRKVLSCE